MWTTLVGLPHLQCSLAILTLLSAHIGGFVMGLFVGVVFYPIISESKRHKTVAWVFKMAAIPAAIILFVLLVKNFYTSDPYAGMAYSHP